MSSQKTNIPTNQRIILDLCGGTGSWSKPYKDNGYIVHNITLPHFDLFETEMDESSGTLTFKNHTTGKDVVINASEVYGILAAPMCTHFSLARTTAKTPRDLQGAMKLVEQCLKIIWFCRWQRNSSLKFWALENPMGLLRQFLGVPQLTFDPCDYGDHYTKRTDLWGYFKLPTRSPYTLTNEEKELCSQHKAKLPGLPDGYVLPTGWRKQAARRSMTSPYFANAFYKANK